MTTDDLVTAEIAVLEKAKRNAKVDVVVGQSGSSPSHKRDRTVHVVEDSFDTTTDSASTSSTSRPSMRMKRGHSSHVEGIRMNECSRVQKLVSVLITIEGCRAAVNFLSTQHMG